MTTASWSTVLDQSTDAAFQTWTQEIEAKFAAVGMVKTADTGQATWSAATRPSIGTAFGYSIWKLSSGNLFFKIEYGSGNAITVPNWWITVGTGSNGSGTLTGQLSTRTAVSKSSTAITSTVTNYQSYLCATANYFGLSWKIASNSISGSPRLFLAVMQTVDNTGAATSVGYSVFATGTTAANTYSQCVATAAAVTGTAFTVATTQFAWPMVSTTPASSSDGAGNLQAVLSWFVIWGSAPMSPNLHVASVLPTDLAVGVTATMTLVGATPHTYLSAATSVFSDMSGNVTSANLSMAMLFE